ncbi:MAG: ribonuclease III [Verrucomicrobia bacterium]|nr:ribonuclease III [Verrucomicrobiota bacterium]
MTHPSLGHETKQRHFDNQRLEFLGDAVLQLIFTDYLFKRFPHANEGTLTKLRARIVSREGLCCLSKSLGLGQHLMMGKGEETNGGRTRASTLSDVLEAIVGAIYLDSDFITIQTIILRESQKFLEAVEADASDKNPKGKLQETLQSISGASPIYSIVQQSGPDHDRNFIAKVHWNGIELGSGAGHSKKEAEAATAQSALELQCWLLPHSPGKNKKRARVSL